jgi:hypothetical protein
VAAKTDDTSSQCNGAKPCNTCTKRNLTCSYAAEHGPPEISGSPTKRRHIDTSPKPNHGIDDAVASTPAQGLVETHQLGGDSQGSKPDDVPQIKPEFGPAKLSAEAHLYHQRHSSEHELELHSRNSTISGPDEETVLYSTTRMLQDQTGRLCKSRETGVCHISALTRSLAVYLGDSATLSYLHLFRYIVETISGPSLFTNDPRKERIVENVVALPPHVRPPCIPPEQRTAEVLVQSFFTNVRALFSVTYLLNPSTKNGQTAGLVEVFDKKSFRASFDSCYSNPLSADPAFLCHLYLIFAIGLVLATPEPDTPDDVVIKRLRSSPFDQAELFFRSAKCLGDPLSGFEDADFWSVQALLLMSVYMLAVSKRNAAYAYHGMTPLLLFLPGGLV